MPFVDVTEALTGNRGWSLPARTPRLTFSIFALANNSQALTRRITKDSSRYLKSGLL